MAMDVSRAIRLAAVSLANRGVAALFAGDAGAGVAVLSGMTFWYTLFLNAALGPEVMGVLR